MILWHIILLAIVQGITEPLPISSSGHLAFTHILLGNADGAAEAAQSRLVDIALHLGTLGALVLYFWKDVYNLVEGGLITLKGKFKDPRSLQAQYIIVASIPAIIAGVLMAKVDPEFFYEPARLGWMLLIFGVLLGLADHFGKNLKTVSDMTFKNAIAFGLAQVLALIPGVSRSGITMTAGRALGFDRLNAARFSFWMAMVATAGAGAYGIYEVIKEGNMAIGQDFALAAFFSFFTTYAALQFLMRWLVNHNFMVFVVYRVLAAIVWLSVVYMGIVA